MTRTILSLVAALPLALAHADVRAQCAPQWQPGGGIPGTDGTVDAMTTWDPDGSGPLVPLVVLGGTFSLAGTEIANHVVAWDPAGDTWSTLAGGTDGDVTGLAALPGGGLAVIGRFTQAGAVPGTTGVAIFDGTSWQPLGQGIAGDANALAVGANGELFVGGQLTLPGSGSSSDVYRWNGSTWTAIPTGLDGAVDSMATMPNGDVVAGGNFDAAVGPGTRHVMRWNGTSWTAVGSGMVTATAASVRALAVMPNGDLIAGGTFNWAGGIAARNIARWNGTSWTPVGTGCDGPVDELRTLASGQLLVGGAFDTAGGQNFARIARWNGAVWSGLPDLPIDVRATTELPNGDLVAGGFVSGNLGVKPVGRWDGNSWSGIGRGFTHPVLTTLARPDGTVVVGGDFHVYPVLGAHRIAAFDGSGWSSFGAGMDAPVRALANLPNGAFAAGGDFTTADGTTIHRVAVWDGNGWSGLGGGTNASVHAIAVLDDGDLVVGGTFTSAGGVLANRVARWDGSSWTGFGNGLGGSIYTLLELPNGDLVAGGHFIQPEGAGIFRWDGTEWSPFGGGILWPGRVRATALLPNGDVIAAGSFAEAGGTPVDNIARWDGATWAPLGAGIVGEVYDLQLLPNGDLLASGRISSAGGAAVENLARWDGSAWSDVDGGLPQLTASQLSQALSMAPMPDGDLFVGGSFSTAGGATSVNLARLSPACPATAVPFGAGCVGSGGLNELIADNLPWLGSTFRATGVGLPAVAWVSKAWGFSTLQLPFSAVLPQGLPGCDLLISPDIWDVVPSTDPTLVSELIVPASMTLAGFDLYHQLHTFGLDATFAIAEVTSSNALHLTLGSL